MTYNVLKDFTDSDFKVQSGDGKLALSKATGDTFTPAEFHYPQNKVDALVTNGTLQLVAEPPAHAAKKK